MQVQITAVTIRSSKIQLGMRGGRRAGLGDRRSGGSLERGTTVPLNFASAIEKRLQSVHGVLHTSPCDGSL